MRLSNPSDRLTGCDFEAEDISVFDFWRWAYSILSNDPTKGELAEWIVGKLLGIPTPPGGRIEGADWDLRSPEGVTIEVKSAAYWQAWKLRDRTDGTWLEPTQEQLIRLTKIRFAGLHRRPAVGEASPAAFKADLYVLCLQHEKDAGKWDGVDLSQWSFYLFPRQRLEELKKAKGLDSKDGKLPKSFDLPLDALEKHAPRLNASAFRVEARTLIEAIAKERDSARVSQARSSRARTPRS